jgi:hypothetical protein
MTRVRSLERELAALRSLVAGGPLLAQLTHARDVRLIRTCEVPGESEEDDATYAEPGDNVFPFRFVDAHFTPADEAGDVDPEIEDRSTEEEDPTYGLLVGGGWLEPDTLAVALWQPGLQPDDAVEEDGEAGEWWIVTGPQIVIGKTNGTVAKGTSGTQGSIFIYDADEEDTERQLTVRNRFRTVADEKWAAAATINGHWYLIAGECD